MTSARVPVVSIIVPARNEEACLQRCLEFLVSQEGIHFEIIVVDDASTDRTGEIARSFAVRPGPTVTVITAPLLPENWTGKNNAMSAGAKIAKGNWLLFTDADTFHKPGSLSHAISEAEHEDAALLSYSPEQEVETFWEKAVMPVIFAELAARYPPAKVRDPNSPIAAANGQYLLISRDAYDAVGGHAKIASDLLEDVAMAGLVKSSGRKVWFRYGGDAVRTRMYSSWPQMREGWTKNLALLFSNPAKLAQEKLGVFLVVLLAPLSLARGAYWKAFLDALTPPMRWNAVLFGIATCLIVPVFALLHVIRLRRAHFAWTGVVFGFFGLPVFAYLLWKSDRAYKSGRFDWKDRSYVYNAEEVKNLTHGFSAPPRRGTWQKILARIRTSGKASS